MSQSGSVSPWLICGLLEIAVKTDNKYIKYIFILWTRHVSSIAKRQVPIGKYMYIGEYI